MQRRNSQSIAEVLREYIESLQIRRKLKESRIERQWEELVGKNAASLTRRIYIKNGVMYVYVNSSVLRNELLMMRETLIARVNELADEEIVKKIILR